MADNINFLQGIPIPQFGGDFAQQFTDFCNAVKNNFERLISIQYTKGNDGNSVEAKELIIDCNLGPDNNLSVLGYGLVSTIFGNGAFKGDNYGPEDDYHDGLNDPWQGMLTKEQIQIKLEGDPEDPTIKPIAPVFTFDDTQNPSGHHSIPQILNDNNEGFKVNVVVDEHNGKAYLAVPYVFIDGRIEDLNRYIENHANSDDIYKNFYDFSTVVYGTAEYNRALAIDGTPDIENWKWTLWRNDLVPKLYFDDNVNEFCWQVNGQQTGVTAQGIKGDDGYTSQSLMALGSRTGDIITIQKLQVINEQGVVEYVERNRILKPVRDNTNNIDVMTLVWPNDSSNPNKSVVIRNIDFVLVFYEAANHTDEETGNPPSNFAFLGRPIIRDNGDVIISCAHNESDNIFDAINKQVLRDYLNNIYNLNNGGTHYADLRGLYIPSCQSTNDVTIRDKAHMTYSENDLDTPNGQNPDAWTKLRTSPVLMDKTHSSQTSEPWSESGSHVGDWRVDYNLKVTGRLDVGGPVSAQSDINTQGNLGVQGNTIIQGGLTVGGHTYLQGNITVQGQLTAQGGTFRPIKDTHMATISRFKDIRCEISRDIDLNGITYNTKLATTLNIRIGRVSRIQGLQGDLAWDHNRNINTTLHKVVAMYGCQANYSAQNNTQGMWYDQSGNFASTIQSATNNITGDSARHNGPKMYDVVEYSIPISIAKTLNTHVKCTTQGHRSGGGDLYYAVQYDSIPSVQHRIFNDGDIYQLQGAGDAFNTPSFRIQDYKVGTSNPSDNYIPRELLLPAINGSVSALTDKFMKFSGNFHGIQGTLDYMGTTINYYVDFYIRIFEAAAVQQSIASNTNVNNTITILPVGYISFINPDDQYTYRAPIYGGVAVKNYLPKTLNGLLFLGQSNSRA